MKQGKRKLQLDRTTIRPLRPDQLRGVAGGTFYASGEGNSTSDYNDSELVCTVSNTQNYSNQGC
jgi:hypothetical protein